MFTSLGSPLYSRLLLRHRPPRLRSLHKTEKTCVSTKCQTLLSGIKTFKKRSRLDTTRSVLSMYRTCALVSFHFLRHISTPPESSNQHVKASTMFVFFICDQENLSCLHSEKR